jgi:excisionase family DNA binding protein
MSDFLTTHQAEDLLHVDRATIYRMLRDGRLKGNKIGSQWRFSRAEVERLLRGEPQVGQVSQPVGSAALPVGCIQPILDLFSRVSQLGSLLLDRDGALITRDSGLNPLCQVISGSRSGREACQGSWRSFIRQGQEGIKRFTCHAGLNYLGEPITPHKGQEALVGALFVMGPFYWQPPDAEEEAQRLHRIAEQHGLSYVELAGVAHIVPIIPLEQHTQMEEWARAASRAIQSIVHERAVFSLRMQQIASLTQIP